MPYIARRGQGGDVLKAKGCLNCHDSGAVIDFIGTRDAWVPRLKQGVEHAVRSAIRGHGGMPPRGDRADLTDTEIRSAILYMYNPGAAAKASVPAPAAK